MAGKLSASFVLKLEDQLSGGLMKLQRMLEGLRSIGQKLGLGGLQTAGTHVEQLTRNTNLLTRALSNVVQVADRAGGALTRMAKRAGAGLREASEKIGAIGGLVAGVSIVEPVRVAAEIDNILRHQAIFSGASGAGIDTEVNRLKVYYTHLAHDMGRPFQEIGEAGFYLQQSQMAPDTVASLLKLSAMGATAYNANTLSVAKTAFSLHENLGIGEDQIGQALAVIGSAAKLQHFQFQDYAELFPQVAAVAALQGVKGMQGATDLAAMLVTGRAGAATPGEAATNLTNFIVDLNEQTIQKKFAKFGINLPRVISAARKAGVDPLESVIGLVAKLQKAHPNDNIAGEIFQRISAQQFVGQMVTHLADYQAAKLHIQERASLDTFFGDFEKSAHGLAAELNRFDAVTKVLMVRLGDGFAPVLSTVSEGLYKVVLGLEWLDRISPGVGSGTLTVVGGLLAVVSVLGALGFVGPLVAAGFALVITPIGLVITAIALLGALALALQNDWAGIDAFFSEKFAAIAGTFHRWIDPLVELWRSFLKELGLGSLLTLNPGAAPLPLDVPMLPPLGIPGLAYPDAWKRTVGAPTRSFSSGHFGSLRDREHEAYDWTPRYGDARTELAPDPTPGLRDLSDAAASAAAALREIGDGRRDRTSGPPDRGGTLDRH